MRNLVPPSVVASVKAEVIELLGKYATRRDIVIPETGNTPRFMSNVSAVEIAKHGRLIPAIYYSPSLNAFLGRITDDSLIPCPWKPERFLINRLEGAGDTHGWHWDDYPFSLLWVLEAPPAEEGGLVQCIPHTQWDKKHPGIEEYLVNDSIRTYYHRTGDIYLLQADTTLHRVTPLKRDAIRCAVNMAWERAADADRVVTHETMDNLYGPCPDP